MYGSISSPLHLARTIIIGKNATLVCDLLHLLTYFIRCSDIKENNVRIEREKDSLYRFSGSSWGESVLSQTPGTPDSVQSWIEKASLVEDDKVFTEAKVAEHSKNPIITPRTFIEDFKNSPVDTTVCYCGLLQKLDCFGEKNIASYLKHSDNKKIKKLLNGSDVCFSNVSNPKSCKGCRTLEKDMFVEYCDKCKKQENLSLEIDLVCQHCINRLDKHNTQASIDLSQHTVGKLEKSNVSIPEEVYQQKEYISIPMKASFTCYCCSKDEDRMKITKQNVDDSYSDDGYNIISRERTMSDPVDCQNLKLKTGLLRNSTTSHDSGNETAYSVCSSTHENESDLVNLTRTNSLSSQDDLLNNDHAITTDIDSDYCSVEKEQLSNTVDNISLSNTENRVPKSISSTTLKEMSLPLSSSVDGNDIIKEEEEGEDSISTLDVDLQTMNLKEVLLPK